MSKMNSAIAGAGAGASVGGPWGAAIGGVAGYLTGSDDKSEDIYAQMLKEAQKIPLPVLKEYYPELYQQVVELNPEMESAVNLGPSEMAGISTDPALRQAQLKALGKLQEVGDAGGMDAQFMSDSNQVLTDINAANQGREGAIQQNLATRGLSGGMSELVARNMSAQNASNQHAQSALDLKAQAEQRALQSLMQSGQLAGQMQGQDFNQASAKAQAADSIARFNAANTQDVNARNVQSKNNAQQLNAQAKQSVADQNTGLKNTAQLHNSSLAQQRYENELRKRGLINTAAQGQAQASATNAQNQDKFVGGLIDSGAKYYSQNQKKKEDGGYY